MLSAVVERVGDQFCWSVDMAELRLTPANETIQTDSGPIPEMEFNMEINFLKIHPNNVPIINLAEYLVVAKVVRERTKPNSDLVGVVLTKCSL